MKSLAGLLLLTPIMNYAQNYAVTRAIVDGVDVVRLTDAARKTEVAVATSIGNIAYEMKVNGKNAFWTPFASVGEMKAKPALAGNPFLAPWANRLDQDAFFANGKKFQLDTAIGNLRRDGHKNPIHGLLLFSPLWRVTSLGADDRSAWVASRLEFARHPELMAQFPFAHTYEMTYRLAGGVLEVDTAVENHASEAMPLAIGYHPYFQVHDAPRDDWKVRIAARDRMQLSPALIPTGERRPVESADVKLATTQLDDVFTGLVRGTDGRAEFWVEGRSERVTVTYGPKYTVAVIYAPPGRGFICFEPMTAITNAFNLAHAGVYKELQSVPAGGQWRESFWISVRPAASR
ncbi:MAG: aldose 1-epimerase [Bryobacteraceae bacterium]